ncbi:MAG: putative phosphoesterase [Flavipsychrobacter sp.]|nr:putative phosphoesterase [Flavipsychrobacter sp.]
MTAEINNIPFTLLPQKALFKDDERLLIIADVHLGKASHFRKGGISIPAHAQLADYTNLEKLIKDTNPLNVYFLGDLFHSTFNRDWHYFCDLIALFPVVKFTLVKGNHDLIDHALFKDICIDVVNTIEDDHFIYSHEPLTEVSTGKVNIVGHIHPGIVLTGIGRQSIKLPCFYITDSLVILPAFGVLTGLYSMERTKDTQIFAVLPDSIKRI